MERKGGWKMKINLIIVCVLLLNHSEAQLAKVVKTNDDEGRKFWIIAITNGKDSTKTYWASCFFRPVSELPDSVKVSLIESLLEQIEDTAYCFKPVAAISYRYNGRFNKKPQSKVYNIQVAALILINYIALNSEAVEYSPFPVLYDTQNSKEFSTAGADLESVIEEYEIWFKGIKNRGFVDYSFPLKNSRYQWYGTLYLKGRTFKRIPQWSKFYDCPRLAKEQDY
jgi:hypothetical protein